MRRVEFVRSIVRSFSALEFSNETSLYFFLAKLFHFNFEHSPHFAFIAFLSIIEKTIDFGRLKSVTLG